MMLRDDIAAMPRLCFRRRDALFRCYADAVTLMRDAD